MQNVITIVTNSQQEILDDAVINKVFIALEKAGGLISNIKWLAEEEACDIFFDNSSAEQVNKIVADKLSNIQADFAVQENKNRKKKMLISDMDSTIIQQECIDEIADKLGIKDKVSAITERAMNGELDFKASLRERVALLKGLGEAQLDDVYNNHIELTPGASELVGTMNKNGAHCILVSGGFTFFTAKIAEKVGFAAHYANRLLIEDGKLTGEVVLPILDQQSKLQTLENMVEELSISKDDVMAVGDGANDLPMLTNAGIGIAYHAKDAVQAEVAFKINHTNLKSLLYMQGYSSGEIFND